MTVLWIIVMALSGLAVAAFSDHGLAVGLAFVALGVALVVAIPLMNFWMPLILLVPVMVSRAAVRTVLGILFSAILVLIVVMPGNFLIAEERARQVH